MGKIKKKWMMYILLLTAVCFYGVFLFFDNIIGKEWADKKNAVEIAYAKTMMVQADKVESYVGDFSYQIVYGKDKIGQSMIAWIAGDTDIHAVYTSEGMKKEEAIAKVKASNPGNKVIRATPGKLGDDYVWEVYYKRNNEGAAQFFYDYYRFGDGAYLDTYRLSLGSTES